MGGMMSPTVIYEWLGRQPYRAVWDYQRRLLEQRVANKIGDRLLLVEHLPTYTLGKSGDQNHLLAGDDELTDKKIDFVPIDRGGDITYHGPGQLVGYPILHLENYRKDVHWYIRQLEEAIIRTIAEYGIEGTRDPEYTGVWVNEEKIAAIGVKVSRWVTMHGFALNVTTDLSYFGRIIPCGIFHKAVCSIQSLTTHSPTLREVWQVFVNKFEQVFQCTVRPAVSPESDDQQTQIATDRIQL